MSASTQPVAAGLRFFRDAQTVRQHGFMCESRFETVGQVYLGVEPEFPFVVF